MAFEPGAGVDEVGEGVGVGLGEAVGGEPEEFAAEVLGDPTVPMPTGLEVRLFRAVFEFMINSSELVDLA